MWLNKTIFALIAVKSIENFAMPVRNWFSFERKCGMLVAVTDRYCSKYRLFECRSLRWRK
jgi:hypothetical protein